MDFFVNPGRDWALEGGTLQFDFPADLIGVSGVPNVNIQAPGQELLYGLLGNPKKEQGHPRLREVVAEDGDPAQDPKKEYGWDQILDRDKTFEVFHTGRISGSFASLIAGDTKATVNIWARPVAPNHNAAMILLHNSVTAVSNPAFWKFDGITGNYIYTVHEVIDPAQKSLDQAIYRLVSSWDFETTLPGVQNLSLSGFDENVAFKMTDATRDDVTP